MPASSSSFTARCVLPISRWQEKYKASFLEDLLLNNVKADIEIHNRARLYGWDFTNGGLAAVVDINNIKKYFIDRLDSNTNRMLEEATELIFRNSIHEMHQTFPQAKYFRQSDLIVFYHLMCQKTAENCLLTS